MKHLVRRLASLTVWGSIALARSGAEQSPSPAKDTMWLSFKGQSSPGNGKHIVIIAAEQEHRSEQSMPMLAEILSTHHGFDSTVSIGLNEIDSID